MASDSAPSTSTTANADPVVTQRVWRRAKAPVKRALSHRPLHWAMTAAATLLPEPHRARLPAPSYLRSVRAEMAGARFVMLAPDRCILAKELYWGHGKRPGRADQTALDVFGALARRATTVLDIGSYTGIFSLLSASVSPTVRVHAFEVVPEVYLAALRNVIANDLVGRVRVHLCGVGSGRSEIRVGLGAGGSALPDFLSLDTARADGGDAVTIPCVEIDSFTDLLDEPDPQVLIKIDIEGGEPAAFASGHRLLTSHHPDILCEVLPATDVTALQAQLRGLGYSFYLVRAGELERRDTITGDTGYRDWLFTTRSAAALAEAVGDAATITSED